MTSSGDTPGRDIVIQGQKDHRDWDAIQTKSRAVMLDWWYREDQKLVQAYREESQQINEKAALSGKWERCDVDERLKLLENLLEKRAKLAESWADDDRDREETFGQYRKASVVKKSELAAESQATTPPLALGRDVYQHEDSEPGSVFVVGDTGEGVSTGGSFVAQPRGGYRSRKGTGATSYPTERRLATESPVPERVPSRTSSMSEPKPGSNRARKPNSGSNWDSQASPGPAACAPATQDDELRRGDDLDYDGYTSQDTCSGDTTSLEEFRLAQVKHLGGATNSTVTQYWHWVEEDQMFEHQVLADAIPAGPGKKKKKNKVKWGVLKDLDFHLCLDHIASIMYAAESDVIVVETNHDDGSRGHVLLAKFKRHRTKARFLAFVKREGSCVRKTDL